MSQESLSPKDSLAQMARKILEPYQERFLSAFLTLLPDLGPSSTLRDAIEYAMTIGGKRLRPAIVYMMAEAVGLKKNVDLPAIVAEMFHISSLITDDLPCMDNDDFRRGKPTTHRVFSESTALLASFALTSIGFEVLSRIVAYPDDIYFEEAVLREAVSAASHNIGLMGIIGGQSYDLDPTKLFAKYPKKEALEVIIDQKTGSLFVLSFLFGFMYGGGDFAHIDAVKKMAVYFGRAFQISDDLDDFAQDLKAQKLVNYAIAFGVDEAKRVALENIRLFICEYENLGLQPSGITKILAAIEASLRL